MTNIAMKVVPLRWLLVFLSLANLAHAAKYGYFWHVSDLHYAVNFSLDGDVRHNCRRWTGGNGPGGGSGNNGVLGKGRQPEGVFGDYNCDAPWSLLESAAEFMKKGPADADIVLWTGAGPVSGREQRQAVEKVTQLLHHVFQSPFVFPVLGPGAHHPDHYKAAAELWRHWLPEEAMTTFHKGGYYTIELKNRRLRIVALNTNLWLESAGRGSKDSWEPHRRGREGVLGVLSREQPWELRESKERAGREPHEQDPSGQWEWLEAIMSKARRAKETVYLVGHAAPGADERQPLRSPSQVGLKEHHNARFLNIIKTYADTIVGQFYGNRHSDTFRIVHNDAGVPVSWLLLTPSVTPRQIQGSSNNPGLRLYRYEIITGQVQDYSQYYLDLNEANRQSVAEWQWEYNLTHYYDLREVSARALNDLAESFIMPEGSEGYRSFVRYYRANSVALFESPEAGGCSSSCQRAHYCAISRLDYTDYRSCLLLEAAQSASRAAGASVLQTPLNLSLFAATLALILAS